MALISDFKSQRERFALVARVGPRSSTLHWKCRESQFPPVRRDSRFIPHDRAEVGYRQRTRWLRRYAWPIHQPQDKLAVRLRIEVGKDRTLQRHLLQHTDALTFHAHNLFVQFLPA